MPTHKILVNNVSKLEVSTLIHDTVTESLTLGGCVLRPTVERHLRAVCNDGYLHPPTGLLPFNQPHNGLRRDDFCRQWHCAWSTRCKCRACSSCTVSNRVTGKCIRRSFIVEKRRQLAILHTQHLNHLPIELQLQQRQCWLLQSWNLKIFAKCTLF